MSEPVNQSTAAEVAPLPAPKREMVPGSVFVGVPCGEHVHAKNAASMVALVMADSDPQEGKGRIAGVCYRPGLYVGVNRGKIVQEFLESDAQWLLMIDSDIQFDPDLPEKLLAVAEGAEASVVAVDVKLNVSPTSGYMKAASGLWTHVKWPKYSPGGFVDGFATATFIAERAVFLLVQEKFGLGSCFVASNYYHPERGVVEIGEDFSFSERCRQLGIKMYLTREIPVAHLKTRGLLIDSPGWTKPPDNVHPEPK